jgi:hypothetical protein
MLSGWAAGNEVALSVMVMCSGQTNAALNPAGASRRVELHRDSCESEMKKKKQDRQFLSVTRSFTHPFAFISMSTSPEW